MAKRKKPRRREQAGHGRISGTGRGPAEANPGADHPIPDLKLSDALVDVARPILEHPATPEDPETFRAVLLLAGAAWNAVRDPGADREPLLRSAGALAEHLGRPRESAAEIVRLLERRARERYPRDPRQVVDVRIRDGGEELRIRVMSMMGVPRAGPAPHAAESTVEARPGLTSRIRSWLSGAWRGRAEPPVGPREAGSSPPARTSPSLPDSLMKRSPTDGSPSGSEASVFQLKITLQDLRPAVWRRVLVPEDTTLVGLHRVIQAAMGWEDYHLWKFEVGGAEYGEKGEMDWGRPVRSARTARLDEVADPGDVLRYEYDFGDSWEHRVRVEKVLPAEPGREYPVCVAAERACPPEDCGGVWGYQHLLEVLSDPADPEHDEMQEWVGGEFDPEHVDLDEINQHLALTRPRESEGGWDGGEEEGEVEDLLSLHHLAEAATGEAADLVRRLLERNPDATLDDMNSALRAASAGYNARPQPELGGLAPEQVHGLLFGDPEWTDEGPVRLDAAVPLAELEGSRTLHDARLLLALLGERGEVKATPKGNLPRAAVSELYERMRRPPDFPDHWFEGRKVINEEDVSPVHRMRILLEVAGLIKRRKGAFSLTRAGERLLDESRAGELFATLFRVHFRRLNLALLDGVGPVPGFQHTIAYSLYRFGRVGAEWHTPAELKTELVLPAVRREVPQERGFDPLEILLENRLLRPLEGFGLAEVQELPREPGSWRDMHRYRKSPLFDRFLRFELAMG
jgi:hypothetical protein